MAPDERLQRLVVLPPHHQALHLLITNMVVVPFHHKSPRNQSFPDIVKSVTRKRLPSYITMILEGKNNHRMGVGDADSGDGN